MKQFRQMNNKKTSTCDTFCWFVHRIGRHSINFIILQSSARQYSDQEKIIRQGDPSDSFWILLRGNATIWVDTVSVILSWENGTT